MRHFVSPALIESDHDYQTKIRYYRQDGYIPSHWVVETDADCIYYLRAEEKNRRDAIRFVELVWYQLDEFRC